MRSLLALVLVTGCAMEGIPANGGDPPIPNTNLPTWQLEDVNPASPRVGETYGVAEFSGQKIVVTLLLGF